jgi:hypothetical protein
MHLQTMADPARSAEIALYRKVRDGLAELNGHIDRRGQADVYRARRSATRVIDRWAHVLDYQPPKHLIFLAGPVAHPLTGGPEFVAADMAP